MFIFLRKNYGKSYGSRIVMMAPNRIDATFTIDQEVFIVEKFSLGNGPVQVKHAFIKEFGFSKKFHKLSPFKFTKVWKRFRNHFNFHHGLEWPIFAQFSKPQLLNKTAQPHI